MRGLIAVIFLLLSAATPRLVAATAAAEAAAADAAADRALSQFASREHGFAALAPYFSALPAAEGAAAAGLEQVAEPINEAQWKRLWARWKAKYKVSYQSPQEDAKRYAIFKANVRQIFLDNADATARSWSAINKLTAMTAVEFQRLFAARVPPLDIKKEDTARPKFAKVAAVEAPRVVDWRKRGKVTPAKDQGMCNSCYAFSAAAQIESHMLIERGQTYGQTLIDLSEQQIVDCAAGVRYDGCAMGGTPDIGLDYAARPGEFITTEARYPYTSGTTGRRGVGCKDVSSAPKADRYQLAWPGWEALESFSAAALREEVAKRPVQVSMKAVSTQAFVNYGGGIFAASRCNYPAGKPSGCPIVDGSACVDHALVVVGYNMDNSPPFWILKNSWSKEWGVNGYVNVEMTGDGTWGTCFMYTQMVKIEAAVPLKSALVSVPQVAIRLAGGPSDRAGRLEVYRQGQWGTVCDDEFHNLEASVVCQQLGFGNNGVAHPAAYFGEGTGPIWLDDVRCTGIETRIEQCNRLEWGQHDCDHGEDVGVECAADPSDLPSPRSVRLVNGPTPQEGRLEVRRLGANGQPEWGTVCDDGFDDVTASVVCGQLGLGSSGIALGDARYGKGAGPIFLDDVKCRGGEERLQDCAHRPWGQHDCDHGEDVGVRCF